MADFAITFKLKNVYCTKEEMAEAADTASESFFNRLVDFIPDNRSEEEQEESDDLFSMEGPEIAELSPAERYPDRTPHYE